MSAVPQVISALIAVLQAHPGLSGVQIVDGPPVVELQQDAILIGFTPVGTEAASTDEEPSGLKGDRETIRIQNLATAWRGNEQDISAVRARSYELLAEVRTALKGNLRINDTAARGRITRTGYMPEQTTKGAIADVSFTITVDGFLS